MISLVLAEQRRLLSRRITRFFPLILATLMILGGILAIVLINVNDGSVDFVNDLLVADTGPSEDGVPDQGIQILCPLGFLIPIMGFVIAASYFGADERAGMIEHLLTWEPRRWRLLLARAISGSFWIFVISSLLSALFVGVLWSIAAGAGTTDGMTSELWSMVGGTIVRSGITGSLFFLLGLGFTVLINSSIGAIVSFLIYAFVVELIIGNILPVVGSRLPMTNASTFVFGADLFVTPGPFDSATESYIQHGYIMAGIIVLIWGLVMLGAAFARFQTRDVD